MSDPLIALPDSPVIIAPVPGWVTAGPVVGLEQAAFRSGAALAHVQGLCALEAVPQALWRDRLALKAAERCVGMAGRGEGEARLRDALHLLRPGGQPDPVGVIVQHWSRAVARPLTAAQLGAALGGMPVERVARYLDAVGGTPVERAAAVLEAMLADDPRAETAALILADAVLSAAVGRTHLLPILSIALGPRDVRLRADDLRMACHRAVVAGVVHAVPMAADLARRAARLRVLAPKLRAKGAGRAVELFLSRDALAPVALAAFMSDRAARRLCERLVELRAVRELTGRDSFRLYGV
jgi:hypothetical protein